MVYWIVVACCDEAYKGAVKTVIYIFLSFLFLSRRGVRSDFLCVCVFAAACARHECPANLAVT